ncbi:MAG: hypothetical protein H6978_11650 [Gammaproteobacteria bacterium]|nr:hypothetical protein [Gammaproteobacteria bacterium]
MKMLPWRPLLRKAAVSRGFVDPVALMDKLSKFGQPSEVDHPIELLRAGALMHARGLLNARIIQFNRDWRWPYWVSRQFDPTDESFVPRAFSLTHINLTHRNWTAVGLPGIAAYPIVDPAGLVTPYWNGWSLELFVQEADGTWYSATQARQVSQQLCLDHGPEVRTAYAFPAIRSLLRVEAQWQEDDAYTVVRAYSRLPQGGAMAVVLRPFNPEGISFIHSIATDDSLTRWRIDGDAVLELGTPPDEARFSDYESGDVGNRLAERLPVPTRSVNCEHGMASAAAVYRARTAGDFSLTLQLPLRKPTGVPPRRPVPRQWSQEMQSVCEFSVPDPLWQSVTDAARYTLALLSPDDVYPGPYTYRRFWFRDAAFMVHAQIAMGMLKQARQAVANFGARQLPSGYYRSQEGEWDSNGQVLWVTELLYAATGEPLELSTLRQLIAGGRWIAAKRMKAGRGVRHAGLLPAGFSAEHLGTNDYYYWDDFWSLAGLEALARLCGARGMRAEQNEFLREADDLRQTLDLSLAQAAHRIGRPGMPAAPDRQLDAGAIGSIVADYPLQLFAASDVRTAGTVDYLLNTCMVDGAFYQQMIHSGLNAYLTLHLAQVLLRTGDQRAYALMDKVAKLASPTGQWPEAIHPRTGGGCMGDGQHGWAAAEWLLALRNCFIREDTDGVTMGSGIPAAWLHGGQTASCLHTVLRVGTADVALGGGSEAPWLRWRIDWRDGPRPLRIAVPGYRSIELNNQQGSITLERE